MYSDDECAYSDSDYTESGSDCESWSDGSETELSSR